MKHIIITAIATIALCFSLIASVAVAANYWYPVGFLIPASAPSAGKIVTISMGMGNYSEYMDVPNFTKQANWGQILCHVKNEDVWVVSAYKASDFPLSPPSEINCWQSYLGDNWGLKMYPVEIDIDSEMFSGTPFSSTPDDVDVVEDWSAQYVFLLPSGSSWTEQTVTCKRGTNYNIDWDGVTAWISKDGSNYWALISIANDAVAASGRCAFERSGGSTQYHKIDLNWISWP